MMGGAMWPIHEPLKDFLLVHPKAATRRLLRELEPILRKRFEVENEDEAEGDDGEEGDEEEGGDEEESDDEEVGGYEEKSDDEVEADDEQDGPYYEKCHCKRRRIR
jgi:hypothetical protein